jgi:hypothetical protein
MAAKKKTESKNYVWIVMAAAVIVLLVVLYFLRNNQQLSEPLPEFTTVEESARDDMIIEGEETMEDGAPEVTATPSAEPTAME